MVFTTSHITLALLSGVWRGVIVLVVALSCFAALTVFDTSPAAAQAAACNPTPSNNFCSIVGTPASRPTTQTPLATNSDCYTCELFIRLESIGKQFVTKIYNGLAPYMREVMHTAAALYFVILGLFTITRRITGPDLVKKLVTTATVMFFADQFLSQGYSTYERWIVEPMLDGAANYADYILDTAKSLQSSQSQNLINYPTFSIDSSAGTLSKLMGLVEAQVTAFISIAYKLIDAQGTVIGNPVATVLVMILILAFIFILLIFTAFMVEALFKILSMGFIAPLLIVFVAFPITRSITWAALRIIFGACLTVIFASGALGFTSAIVNDYINAMGVAFVAGGSVECTGLNALSSVRVVVEDILGRPPCVRTLEVWSIDFLQFYVIGFISILLHLQSKSLASNLSGANDGVGPAAATVAAGKMGVGMALAAGSGAMFGQAGVRGLMTSGSGMVSSVAQQGVLGSVVQGIRGGGSGPAQSIPGASFSTGEGGSPKAAPSNTSSGGMDQKTQQNLANLIGAAVRGTGSDRNRNGSEGQ